MAANHRIRDQFHRNFVALISLAVAVSGLGYNTWRNEASEHNRNQRVVAIEVLRNLGVLQEVVFHAHYDRDRAAKGNPRTGWALVLTIRDLARILDGPSRASAELLFAAWDARWQDLGDDGASAQEILAALAVVRNDVKTLLQHLD